MQNKIKSIEELILIVEKLKKEGKKIVTTNGSFDILHVAHLRFLEKAKLEGDILIVLLNDDNSIKRFKGDKRPIIPEKERALSLAYLWQVDYVTLFSEDQPLEILTRIKPEIHVKGGTFILERIKEEETLLKSWNGKFKVFETEEGYSTTNIIKKIIETYKLI